MSHRRLVGRFVVLRSPHPLQRSQMTKLLQFYLNYLTVHPFTSCRKSVEYFSSVLLFRVQLLENHALCYLSFEKFLFPLAVQFSTKSTVLIVIILLLCCCNYLPAKSLALALGKRVTKVGPSGTKFHTVLGCNFPPIPGEPWAIENSLSR